MSHDEGGELAAALEDFLFRVFTMSVSTSMDRIIELDLPFSQARTVFLLGQLGCPVPIHQVADALKMSVAAAGRNIDQLVGLGLLDRREDPADRRVKLVSLSQAGQEFAVRHLEHKRQQVRDFTRAIGAQDRDRLLAALTPILAGDALRPTCPRPAHPGSAREETA